MEWGPLLPDGRLDPARKGLYFFSWVNSLVAMGYEWDWRVVNAADFGDATTRERLMVQFVRIGLGGVRWPVPTHAKTVKNSRHKERCDVRPPANAQTVARRARDYRL